MVVLDVTTAPPRKVDSLSPYVARCLDNADICGRDCDCGAVGATIESEPPQCQGVLWRAANATPQGEQRLLGLDTLADPAEWMIQCLQMIKPPVR